MVQASLTEKDLVPSLRLEENVEHILPCGDGFDFFPGQLLMPVEPRITPNIDTKQYEWLNTKISCTKTNKAKRLHFGNSVSLFCHACDKRIFYRDSKGHLVMSNLNIKEGKLILTCECGRQSWAEKVILGMV